METDNATRFRALNVFANAAGIEFRQDYSSGQVHWTGLATGHDHKLSVKV